MQIQDANPKILNKIAPKWSSKEKNDGWKISIIFVYLPVHPQTIMVLAKGCMSIVMLLYYTTKITLSNSRITESPQ